MPVKKKQPRKDGRTVTRSVHLFPGEYAAVRELAYNKESCPHEHILFDALQIGLLTLAAGSSSATAKLRKAYRS